MTSNVTRRFKAGLIAFALVLSQVVMPVQSAFATPGNEQSDEKITGNTKPESEDKKVYVCKYVSKPGEKERIQTGQNPIEVSVNATGGTAVGSYFADAQGRSFVLGTVPMTPEPSVLDCPNVANVNVNIQQTDVCGPNNDTVLATAQKGVIFSYSSWINNKLTVTATLQAGFSWSDGSTELKTFIRTDNATPCVSQDKEVTIPTPKASDPCGLENASWSTQPVAAEYSWSVNLKGELVATTNAGFYFMVKGEKTTTVNFGKASDSGVLCPTVPPCTVSKGMTEVTKDSQFADYQDTRSKGHYEFTSNGLRIYTDDTSSESKVAWYHLVNYSLANVGEPSMNYTSTSGINPGMQLVVDFDGDGTPDGTLVGESVYGNDWWLTNGSAQFVKNNAPRHDGGYGSDNHGTLSQWLTNFPSATVKAVGFSLGSGVKAEGVLKSLTFGCYTWTFKAPVRVPTQCTVTNNMFDREWTYSGSTFPEAGASGGPIPGTFNFEPTGLYLNTPATESYVDGLIDAGNTPMRDVDAMSYKVLRQAKSAGFEATLPAYILLVDTNGPSVVGGEKYFFYEPYNNDQARAAVEGTFQLWDAKAGGSAKWWMSGTGQTLRTWDYFVNQFPDAVVLAYGFNQGTYNAETYSAVQDIQFDCATTSFTNKNTGGNGGGGQVPSTPTTPTVPTTSVVSAPVVAAGGAGAQLPAELPMTGQNGSVLFTWIALLAAILTYGSVYYLQPKKRLEQ